MRSVEWIERLLELNYYIDILNEVGQDVRPYNQQELITEVIIDNIPTRWQSQIHMLHGTVKFNKISDLLNVLQGIEQAIDINTINTKFSKISTYDNRNISNSRKPYKNMEYRGKYPPKNRNSGQRNHRFEARSSPTIPKTEARQKFQPNNKVERCRVHNGEH